MPSAPAPKSRRSKRVKTKQRASLVIDLVAGLPVGLIPGTEYSQTVVTLEPSDLLVLYTDGITEAGNETSQELGREQLLEWARRAPVDSPRALGEDLLHRLELFRGQIRNDDETLLVLQRDEESRLFMLGEVASSYTFGRLLRSLKREWSNLA